MRFSPFQGIAAPTTGYYLAALQAENIFERPSLTPEWIPGNEFS